VLEKEKEVEAKALEASSEELKKDKETLREMLDIKEITIKENVEKIRQLTKKQMEFKTMMAT
jgi:hypothetical protein